MKTVFFNLTFFTFLLHCTIVSSEQGINDVAELTYYKNGKTYKVARNVGEILTRMEWIFLNADDSFLLAINENLLKNTKKEGAVEITYISPKLLKAGFIDKHLNISSLLIPLEGRFTDQHATVFYADPGYRQFNVLVNKNGIPAINHIKELLKDALI